MVASIVIALVSLDFMNINWDIYCSVTRDSAATEAIIKSIQENGIVGLFFNYRVGAPNVAGSWIDASGIDLLLGIIIWLLNLVFRPSTQRLYYLTLIVTFMLASWSMSVLLSKLKVNKIVNFCFSLLFSFGPYHFYRYIYHIALGNSFTIPLAILMCLYVLGIIKDNDDPKKTCWQYIIYGALLGLGCPYYMFFALILFAVMYLFVFIKRDDIKSSVKRSFCILSSLIGLLISRLPSIIMNIMHGKNTLAFARIAEEQELYALKIIQLLLPVKYSRIKFMADITNEYYSHFDYATENYMSSLGIAASVGFLILCSLFIFSFIKLKSGIENNFDWNLINYLSLTTITLLLVADTGGFGEVFNKLITPQFRCYNRVSVVIACISLVILAYIINYYFSKNSILFLAITIGVLGVGLYDQVNIADMKETRPMYEYWDQLYGDFFERVEDSCTPGSMVYQLPFMGYPEVNNIFNLERSKHFVGYLYTDTLRWSFGGIMGRDTLAEEMYIDGGMSDRFVKLLKEIGFSGVYIDIDGYGDYGESILNYYYGLGVEPIVSLDGKMYYFDITSLDI